MQHKRQAEQEQAQELLRRTGRQQDMADADEIRRRYENDAAGGGGGAMPRSDAEEMRREASEQQAG